MRAKISQKLRKKHNARIVDVLELTQCFSMSIYFITNQYWNLGKF